MQRLAPFIHHALMRGTSHKVHMIRLAHPLGSQQVPTPTRAYRRMGDFGTATSYKRSIIVDEQGQVQVEESLCWVRGQKRTSVRLTAAFLGSGKDACWI